MKIRRITASFSCCIRNDDQRSVHLWYAAAMGILGLMPDFNKACK